MLTVAEKLEFIEIGKAATKAGKTKAYSSKSSFGFRSADLRRKAVADWHQGLRARMKAIESEMDEHAALVDIELGGDGLSGALSIAKVEQRLRGSLEVEAVAEDMQALATYASGIGAEETKTMRTLTNMKADVVPFVTEVGAAFQIPSSTSKDDEQAADLIGFNNLHYNADSSLSAGLDQATREFNRTLTDAKCSQECPPPALAPKKCRMFRMCFCFGDGKEIYRMTESLHSWVTKPAAPVDSLQFCGC